jgi:UDP-N-acetylmuramoyl-tripeptide--D-alanyl-D-alanine ligase
MIDVARPDMLWNAQDAAAATGARLQGDAGWQAGGVSIDTRTLQRGDLFVALHGASDGHRFVGAALGKGAAAALVDHRPEDVSADAPLLIVADTQKGLEALGRAGRARSQARYVAVTGSVGKTSTKEALRHVLSAQAPTAASVASYNNHIGVPLTLARVPRNARYAVIEIGTNHPGEIEPLARQARPHVAIVTTVAAVHLENFGSVDDIAREKAAIMAGMKGGTAVLNRDNAYFDALAGYARQYGVARIVSFGRDARADTRLLDSTSVDGGSQVSARYNGQALGYRLGAPGEHWVLNSLAVLAAVDALGGDIATAARALATVAAPAGRGARHRVARPDGALALIDESYNASPTSMRAAFAVLAQATPGPNGRRIAVLGDMLELGPDSPALHAGLAEALVAAGIDRVFTCGPLMENLHRALPASMRGGHATSSAAVLPLVLPALRAGDVVTVKGSLGSKMRQVVEAILAQGAAGRGEGGQG